MIDRSEWDQNSINKVAQEAKEKRTESVFFDILSPTMDAWQRRNDIPKNGVISIAHINKDSESWNSYDLQVLYQRHGEAPVKLLRIEHECGMTQSAWTSDLRSMRKRWPRGLSILDRKDTTQWDIFVKSNLSGGSFFAITKAKYEDGKKDGFIRHDDNVKHSLKCKTCNSMHSILWEKALAMADDPAEIGFAMDNMDRLCAMIYNASYRQYVQTYVRK